MTPTGVRQLALVNVAALVASWSLYGISRAVDARWLAWCGFLVAVVGAVTMPALIAHARRVAGGGRLTTAGAFAGEGIALLTGVFDALHGVSAAHRNELALLAGVLLLTWYVWFGTRLRRTTAGRAALALATAAALLIAARPLTSSAPVLWALALLGLAAYVTWALALPGMRPATATPARPRSRRLLAAHSVWLVLVLLVVAPPLAAGSSRDAVQLLTDGCEVWLIGAWALTGLGRLFRRTH